MSRLEETKSLINFMNKLDEQGFNVDSKITSAVILVDIAKSLAMIADKLCGTESEDTKSA